MATWLLGYLGGLRLSPAPAAGGGNDTSQVITPPWVGDGRTLNVSHWETSPRMIRPLASCLA